MAKKKQKRIFYFLRQGCISIAKLEFKKEVLCSQLCLRSFAAKRSRLYVESRS